MNGKNIILGDKRSTKVILKLPKKLPKIDDIDVNKILISKNESCSKKSSFKFFI